MMKPTVRLIPLMALCGVVLSIPLRAEPPEITDFFNSANSYDYLIITPGAFQQGASRLASYRNGFEGDDVSSAGYIRLDTLLSQFPQSGGSPDTMLRESITWACKNWLLRPSYVVLIGDDSVKTVPEDSIPRNRGPMPTHISCRTIVPRAAGGGELRFDTTFFYNDDWYFKTCVKTGKNCFENCAEYYQCIDPPVAFGRIPCEQPEQLDAYLRKVRRFDSLPLAPWRNRILMLTDDRFQNGEVDNYYHASSTYETMKHFSGRFINGLFLDDYIRTHLPGCEAAKEAFFAQVNRGARWTVFYGHGFPGGLTYEQVVGVQDYARLDNADRPTFFFSICCSNGGFYYPAGSSMCKRFLFSDGGAVAYIASPNMAWFDSGNAFMNRVVRIEDSLPDASIGCLVALATRGQYYERYSNFEVFGDPALRECRRHAPLDMQRDAPGAVLCRTGADMIKNGGLYWEITQGRQWYDSYFQTVEKRDSALFSGTDSLKDGSCRIAIPSLPQSNLLKITVYAWNDSCEAHGSMNLFNDARPSPVHSVACSFDPQIIGRNFLEKTIAVDDSLVMGVVGKTSLMRWRRKSMGYAAEGEPLRLPDTFKILAFAVSPDTAAIVARQENCRVSAGSGLTLSKIDFSGTTRWSCCIPRIQDVRGMKTMKNGDCIAWGKFDSVQNYCVRVDKTGGVVWTVVLHVAVSGAAEAPRGECILVGSVKVKDDSPSPREALCVCRIDSSGDVAWKNLFARDSSTSGNSIARAQDGRWIVSATTYGGGKAGVWLLSLNITGDTLWSRTVENASAVSLLVGKNGALAVSGTAQASGRVALFDAYGTFRFVMSIPGAVRLLSADSSFSRILVALDTLTSDAGASRPGEPPPFFCTSISTTMGESIGILSADESSAGLFVMPRKRRFAAGLSAIALPSRAVLFTLGAPQASGSAIDVFDLSGRRIGFVNVPANATRASWDSDHAAAGVYIARLRGNPAFGAVRIHRQ